MNTDTEQAALLTVRAVARKLGVSRATVYRWIDDEGLPVVELRGLKRVPSRALDAWLREQEERAVAGAP